MRLKTPIIFCLLMHIFTSCEGYEINKDKTSTKSFLGDVIVTNSDGSKFIDKGIRVTLSESLNDKGLYDIFLKKVKFAEKMPVRINMTIPSVEKDLNGNVSGNNIIPWAMGGPFEKWEIHDLKGIITYNNNNEPKSLQFDMICGEYPVSYFGIYTEEIIDY